MEVPAPQDVQDLRDVPAVRAPQEPLDKLRIPARLDALVLLRTHRTYRMHRTLSESVDMSFCTIMQLGACMTHRCLYNRVSIRVPALCRSLHKLVIAFKCICQKPCDSMRQQSRATACDSKRQCDSIAQNATRAYRTTVQVDKLKNDSFQKDTFETQAVDAFRAIETASDKCIIMQ